MDENMVATLEVPVGVSQQEVWSLEKELTTIGGVGVELRSNKDLNSLFTLIIQFEHEANQIIGPIVTAANAVILASKIIHKFLHPDKKESDENIASKRRVIVKRKNERFELYDLSVEEIAKILEKDNPDK